MNIVLVFLILSAFEEYSPDPFSVFQSSDSLLVERHGFSYSFLFTGTGPAANIIPAVSGKTTLSRSPDVQHPLMILEFTDIESTGSKPPFPVPSSYIATEDSLYRFDFNGNTVQSSPVNGNAAGVFDFPPAAVMMELVMDEPFQDELAADSIQVLTPDTVRGEPCHVFRVFYGEDLTALWYISIQDSIPRAVERITPAGGAYLEIWNMEGGDCIARQGEAASDVFLADRDGFVRKVEFPRERAVLLVFFTSRGSNSLTSLGLAGRMQRDNLDVFAVSVMENGDLFGLRDLNITFPVLVFGESAAMDYGVELLPSAVLIDPDGVVLGSACGINEMESDEFAALLHSL